MRPYLPRYGHTCHLPSPSPTYSNPPGPFPASLVFDCRLQHSMADIGLMCQVTYPQQPSKPTNNLELPGSALRPRGALPFVVSWMQTGSAVPTLHLTGN